MIHNGDGKIEVKDLIKKYIFNERTLVLVCSEANSDDETQEALEITHEIKERTIRILTKYDHFSSAENLKNAN